VGALWEAPVLEEVEAVRPREDRSVASRRLIGDRIEWVRVKLTMSAIRGTMSASPVHLLLRHGLVLRKFLELLELPNKVLELEEFGVIVGDVVVLQMLISLSRILDATLDNESTRMRQCGRAQWM
jgi:hypothetical protein